MVFLSRLFSKSQHALALEQAPQAIVTINEGGLVTLFNAAAEDLWGYTRASILGQPSSKLFKTSDLSLTSTKATLVRAVQLTHSNGRIFWAELAVSHVQGGRSSRHTIVARDITDERYAREMMNQTLEQAMDAVVSIDEHNNVTFFNKAAEAMWDYNRAEVLGKNVKMLVPANIQSQHDGFVNRNRDTGENRIVGSYREITVPRKDGSWFWGQAAISKIKFDGRITYTAFFKDVTEEARGKKPGPLLQGKDTDPETVKAIR